MNAKRREKAKSIENLLRHICTMMKDYGRQLLKEFNLTPIQFDLMVILYLEDICNQAELPSKMSLAKSTISSVLDKLEKGGYAKRHRMDSDKRASAVELTTKGRSVIDQVIERRTELISRALENIELSDHGKLLDILRGVRNEINDLYSP